MSVLVREIEERYYIGDYFVIALKFFVCFCNKGIYKVEYYIVRNPCLVYTAFLRGSFISENYFR